MSKVCFQLVRDDGSGEAVELPVVDNELCAAMGVQPSAHDWYAGWYDKVGPKLACGTTFDKLLGQLDWNAHSADSIKQVDRRLFNAVGWLKNHFVVRCWTEEGTPATPETEALAALERFVVENDDLLALESLVGRFNIFDALGITRAEIRHSNFLAFILDPAESHGQGQLFLKAVLMDLLKQAPPEMRPLSPIDLDGTDLRGVEVRREWKHIDLLIMCHEPQFFVVIENKIGAQESPGALSRYEEAMQKHYPDARPLYVYLTLNADEPAENKWMPYRHADIYCVLKRVRKTYRKAIGKDVLVFLDHYLDLIGARFMNDSDESKRIDELCQRIYTNHRQALDLIRDRVRSHEPDELDDVAKVLEEDSRWEVVARPSQRIDFVPKAWLEWLPRLGLKGDPRSWIYVRLHSNKGRLDYAVKMAPMTDLAMRKEIVPKLRNKCPEFGLKPGKANEVKNSQCRISAVQSILEWGEDDPEPEAIRVAVKKMLDDLYPKLEKMALALKPLCSFSASATEPIPK